MSYAASPRFALPAALALIVMFAAPSVSHASTPPTRIALNTVITGTLGAEQTAEYTVVAYGGGVLTVLLDGTSDLTLTLLDADGEMIASCDSDIDDVLGREAVSVRLPGAGAYTVRVTEIDGASSRYSLIASTIAFEPFAAHKPAAPQADTIGVAETIERVVNTTGETTSSFIVIVPDCDGLLVITTESADAQLDLALETHENEMFDAPIRDVDDDLGEKLASEVMTIAVTRGTPVYLRVVALAEHQGTRYRVVTRIL